MSLKFKNKREQYLLTSNLDEKVITREEILYTYLPSVLVMLDKIQPRAVYFACLDLEEVNKVEISWSFLKNFKNKLFIYNNLKNQDNEFNVVKLFYKDYQKLNSFLGFFNDPRTQKEQNNKLFFKKNIILGLAQYLYHIKKDVFKEN